MLMSDVPPTATQNARGRPRTSGTPTHAETGLAVLVVEDDHAHGDHSRVERIFLRHAGSQG